VELLNLTIGSFSSGVVAATSSYESIASVTASGGETSLTFSSIAGTYASLQIRGISRRNAAGGFANGLQINSDTGSNYAYHYLRGTGAAAQATGASSQTFIIGTASASATHAASIFGVTIFDILDYASTTKYKTVRGFGGFDANGSGTIDLASGLWMNTAAITSVSLYAQGDAFAAGSTFALYGIKG